MQNLTEMLIGVLEGCVLEIIGREETYGYEITKKLNALGIWHFDQVAAWKKKEVEWVGSYLAFPGRIEREEWVKQAKTLAKGGATVFSKRVAKGEVPTSRASKPASRCKGGKA